MSFNDVVTIMVLGGDYFKHKVIILVSLGNIHTHCNYAGVGVPSFNNPVTIIVFVG